MPAGTATSPRIGALGVLSATGAMLYRNAAGNVTDVVPGTNGQVLTLVAGIPDWANSTLAVKEWFQCDGVDAIYNSVNPGAGAITAAVPGVVGTHATVNFASAVARGIVWQKAIGPNYDGGDLVVDVYWSSSTTNVGTINWSVNLERDNAGVTTSADAFAAATAFAASAGSGVANQLVKASATITGAALAAIAAKDPLRLFLQSLGTGTQTGVAQLERVVVTEA